jgi:hypothetical protein
MRTTPRGLPVALALMIILSVSALSSLRLAFSTSPGGEIDVFTQREPYGGRGPNASSDAFGPGKMVQVFALVTYNENPAQGIPVAFEILGPDNPSGRIVFFRSGFTNENGTVAIDFRLSYLNESTFGDWVVYGSAEIGELTVSDMVSFEVGWIVEIVSIRTVDEHHQYRNNFTRGDFVGIELALRSIAMVQKEATLTVMIYDALDMCVNTTEISDVVVPPNGVLVYLYTSLYIPKTAFAGDAYAYASAYPFSPNLSGVPYCPDVSTHFLIITRDVAIISVLPSSWFVYAGEIVNVDVSVRNKGWEAASFNVRAYYNSTLIGEVPVSSLEPFTGTTLHFVWNTGGVQEGIYLISAIADPVPGETELSDNNLNDGFVEVRPKPGPPSNLFHDVAVLNVYPSSYSAYIGEVVEITVVVMNQGDYTESFNVTVSTGSLALVTSPVQGLASGAQGTLVFRWDTSHVSEGDYTLSALASYVPDEVDYRNNRYVDGTVRIATAPRQEFVSDWFYWFLLLLLLILVGILLLAWWYRRRKKSEAAFYSGWTAWYYGYDLRGRSPKYDNQAGLGKRKTKR